jgi:hypothetical protein
MKDRVKVDIAVAFELEKKQLVAYVKIIFW